MGKVIIGQTRACARALVKKSHDNTKCVEVTVKSRTKRAKRKAWKRKIKRRQRRRKNSRTANSRHS